MGREELTQWAGYTGWWSQRQSQEVGCGSTGECRIKDLCNLSWQVSVCEHVSEGWCAMESRVGLHSQGRMHLGWGQRDTDVQIGRLMIVEGKVKNLSPEEEKGSERDSETSCVISVPCCDCNYLTSQGFYVLKGKMGWIVRVELDWYSLVGSILPSKGHFGNSWGRFFTVPLCLMSYSFRTALPNRELSGVLHDSGMTQVAFSKDVTYK